MTEYLFDHDRHARDQWCPGIAGEYTLGVDYEHEHRVAEHEHEEMPKQVYNGVTRATRVAKLLPGRLITVEIVDDLPTPVGHLPTIGSVLS